MRLNRLSAFQQKELYQLLIVLREIDRSKNISIFPDEFKELIGKVYGSYVATLTSDKFLAFSKESSQKLQDTRSLSLEKSGEVAQYCLSRINFFKDVMKNSKEELHY